MPEKYVLRQYQALPLRAKVSMTRARIREWYDHWDGDVCVSFSGGKDSTVLAHLVHSMYPDVPLVFANTGLEYPEIQAFARKMGAEFVRPKMSFSEVISKYGYPIISKENAEAIYVARRIRNGKVALNEKLKAEKAWVIGKREELRGDAERLNPSEEGSEEAGKGYKHTIAKRLEFHDQRVWNPENEEDEEKPNEGKTTGEWVNWRRQAINGTGAFSKEKKSIYNKSKWLPLCRDTTFMISHMCCNVMKKGPMHTYQKKTHLYPYIGTLTEESKLREQSWIRNGCNAFESKNKTSQPMSFWLEQDVLHYIWEEGLEIASVYGELVGVDKNGNQYTPIPGIECDLKCTGCDRTGCVYCAFGAHLKKGGDRFLKLAVTHPKQYEYCMGGGQWVDNPNYDSVAPKMDGEWVNWNPKKIWVPSKEGLGMRHVFEEVNSIYGKDFIKFE